MVDLEVLRRHGLTVEMLRSKFETEQPEEKIDELRKSMWMRANDGIEQALTDYLPYYAIDKAYDVPLRTIYPTLLQAIGNKDPNDPKTGPSLLKILQDFDLTKYLITKEDPKSKTVIKVLDIPAFFEVTAPIVKAYVTIIWAKICNDRRRNPYLSYEPIRNDPEQRLKCAILTGRVNLMANQLSYEQDMVQAAFKVVMYGEAFEFIQSEWFEEKQTRLVSQERINEFGQKVFNFVEQDVVVKEGLTYHVPHPTRIYYDRSYPASSLNTDTGARWAGYWRMKRFRELHDNPKFWNKDRLAIGKDWISNHNTYFRQAYPCAMTFPQGTTKWENDTQNALDFKYYTSDFRDACTMVVEHFEKFIPADFGLGTYPHPVWFRVVFAGEGTVLYMTPLPDRPVNYYHDCVDAGRASNSSTALELIPWQDSISNQLSQAILAAKQNLSSMVWVDTDVMNADQIKELQNPGGLFYQMRKFFGFSGKLTKAQLTDVRNVVMPVNFPVLNVSDTIATIRILLSMLERVVGISAQEAGAQATHEQSAEEMRRVHEGTGNRSAFRNSGIDEGADAKKRQIYSYLMAYGEPEMYVEVPYDPAITPDILAKLGFTVEGETEVPQRGLMLRGRKTALQIESFANTMEGREKRRDVALATAMTQMFQMAFQNPVVMQAVGPEQAILLLNQVIDTLGLPKDFVLRNSAPPQEVVNQEIQKMVVELVQKLMQEGQQATQEELLNGLKPIMEAIKGAKATDDAQSKAIETIMQTNRQQDLAISQITRALNLAPANDTSIDSTSGGS